MVKTVIEGSKSAVRNLVALRNREIIWSKNLLNFPNLRRKYDWDTAVAAVIGITLQYLPGQRHRYLLFVSGIIYYRELNCHRMISVQESLLAGVLSDLVKPHPQLIVPRTAQMTQREL
jgi:hypothetical protein